MLTLYNVELAIQAGSPKKKPITFFGKELPLKKI